MPRKRGISGRKAKPSIKSNIYKNLEQVNKRVSGLKKTGRYGTYASKGLNRFVQSNPHVYVSRKTRQIRVKNLDILDPANIRLINKNLQEFLNDPTSTNAGIETVQGKINEGVRKRFSQYTNKEFTDQDLEDFYDLTHNEDFRYFADKIGDSEMYVILLDYAKDQRLEYDEFAALLGNYFVFPEAGHPGGLKTTGNSDADKHAKRLYMKFMVGLE